VLTNSHYSHIKILFREENGFCLYYKRLEQHRSPWPKLGDNTVTLTGYPLNQLLDGHTVEPHPALHFKSMQ
jgi:transposase